MGTSASYRSPAKDPRWRLVNRAYDAHLGDAQLPLERLRAEIFNASESWIVAITDPAMARFAQAALDTDGRLVALLRHSVDPAMAVDEWSSGARDLAIEEGSTTAAAIGSRALTSFLLRAVVEPAADLSASDSDSAAQVWTEVKTNRTEVSRRFLSSVLEQYVRHVVARDNGRLVAEGASPREARELTRKLAQLGASVAEVLPAREASTADAWADYVREAFKVGRELPR